MATTTAGERRARDKVEYDAFLDVCPSRELLSRISDKWVALVLCALGDGSLRYSQLSRHIAGVSQKMLTQTLRTLERDGLVVRTVTPTVPVTVDYELTDLGRSLREAIRGLKIWAEQNMGEVLVSRSVYDARR